MLATAAAGLLLTPAAARPTTNHRTKAAARTVQLISMQSGGAGGSAIEEDAGTAGLPLSPASPEPSPFAVHDLSRRWVEYQMRARLAEPAASAPASIRADDPVAPQARATPAVAEPDGVLPISAIGIPTWMQGHSAQAPVLSRFEPGCVATPYRPSGFLSLGSEGRRQVYYGMMSSIACQYGIPVGLFDAMIMRESRYDPVIVSPKNAFGLTQLMPATAAGLGVNRYDIEQNLRGGARFLRQQLDHFGQYHLALAAYNAGPGRVHGAVPAITETQSYVADILGKWARLSGLGAPLPAPSGRVQRETSVRSRLVALTVF